MIFILHARPLKVMFIGFALLFLLPAFACGSGGLTEKDCAKCHRFEQHILAASGGRHAEQLTCLDCHPFHQPTDNKTIADCYGCHRDKPHYQLKDCRSCHREGHRPLESLRDPIKPAKKECLSCHQQVGPQMSSEPSQHAQLFCNRCHAKHKQIPRCLDCHSPHQPGQREADCGKCHSAHQPLTIIPAGYVPAGFCRPCHKKQSNDLAATRTLHGGINCVSCHKGQHPFVPSCQSCHGLPHTQSIHAKYRSCLACHGDAHNLINR